MEEGRKAINIQGDFSIAFGEIKGGNKGGIYRVAFISDSQNHSISIPLCSVEVVVGWMVGWMDGWMDGWTITIKLVLLLN